MVFEEQIGDPARPLADTRVASRRLLLTCVASD
jgi:hypothetical protein